MEEFEKIRDAKEDAEALARSWWVRYPWRVVGVVVAAVFLLGYFAGR